jgi:hypothetical protein
MRFEGLLFKILIWLSLNFLNDFRSWLGRMSTVPLYGSGGNDDAFFEDQT